MEALEGSFKIKDNNGNVAEIDSSGRLKLVVAYDAGGITMDVPTASGIVHYENGIAISYTPY